MKRYAKLFEINENDGNFFDISKKVMRKVALDYLANKENMIRIENIIKKDISKYSKFKGFENIDFKDLDIDDNKYLANFIVIGRGNKQIGIVQFNLLNDMIEE